MTKFSLLLLASAIAAPGLIVAASPAQAQSVAVLDPDAAVVNTNAWKTATTTIGTTYKTQIDQITARQAVLGKEMEPLLKPFDTDNDGKLSQAEIQTAQQTRAAQWQAAETKQNSINTELQRLSAPVSRARAYAAEQIANQEDTAVSNVMKAKRVTLLVRPQAALVADPSADLTPSVTTELDRLITAPVSITPPAGWQPGQQQQQGAAPAAASAPAKAGQQQGR